MWSYQKEIFDRAVHLVRATMANFIALLPLYPRIQLCTDPGAMSHGRLSQSIPDNAKVERMQMMKKVDEVASRCLIIQPAELYRVFSFFSGNYC